MLGPVLSRLCGALTLIALWTVGLMAGAVHPLGFLAAVTGLAVVAWFFSALGVSRSLREGGMKRAGHLLALVCLLCGRGRGDDVGGGDILRPRLFVAVIGI